jgi:predicted nucleic acid-binding protein
MNVFFLDGSALGKRYVAEPGTPLVDHLLDHVAADRLIVLNVGFAEVVSILVRRRNAGVLSNATFSQALLHLGQEIIHAANLRKVEPTNPLVIAALNHIQNHSVNSTDAIVLHAALGVAHILRTRGDDLVLVASDQRLLRAAQAEGLATFDPESQDQAALAALIGP